MGGAGSGDDFEEIISGDDFSGDSARWRAINEAVQNCPDDCAKCPRQVNIAARIVNLADSRDTTARAIFQMSGDENFRNSLNELLEQIQYYDETEFPVTIEMPTPIGTVPIEINQSDTPDNVLTKILDRFNARLDEADAEIARLKAIQQKASRSCLGMQPLAGIVDLLNQQTEEIRRFAPLTCTAGRDAWGDEWEPDNNERPTITLVL